jgi:hypothetical protein
VAPLVAPRSIAEVTERAPRTPVRPAPATFAIWAPIFALAAAYAARQAAPGGGREALLRRVGWLTAASFAADTLWEIVVPRERLDAGAVLVAATAGAATGALVGVAADDAAEAFATRDAWLVGVPIGMLAGWTTVAAAISTADALARHGVRAPRSRTRTGAALVLAAGAVAGHVAKHVGGARRPHALAYGAAVMWGLGGIAASPAAGRTGRLSAVVAAVPVALGLAVGRAP